MSTPPVPPCSTQRPDNPVPPSVGQNTRALLSDAQFSAVLATVLDNNPGMDISMGSRIVVEALKFVAAGARTSVGIAPSRVVDEGWHALILHTALYQDLCARLGGAFVHHYPERPDTGRYDHAIHERTADAIRAAGYEPDHQLWAGPEDDLVSVAAKCQHAPSCTIRPMPKPEWPAQP
ncbi:glycine-rich domain-containing protein [Streptomyces sp. NPDC090054]|uniref:glycine-rich domain-containing protein n=1 Tax=Streptomyces sp. NPDC090054 TaxID=3365933 RepID=UPI0037FFA3A7